jgi:hypothetical protein
VRKTGFVSGSPTPVKVMFEFLAVPIMFSHFGLSAGVNFSFFLLCCFSVVLGVIEFWGFSYSGTPWFDLATMAANSTYLPLVMAITSVIHLSFFTLISTYKNSRVVEHFKGQSKAKGNKKKK